MRIVFQGDSITDGMRDRSCEDLGVGYVKYAAALIAARHPSTKFEFINRGIGGNKTEDLVSRWQSDCIDLHPDVVSVMIGVNDTWHHETLRDWIPDEVFEENYRTILRQTKEELPDAKIIMLEQFLLPVADKAYFREDIDPKIHITRALAREYADIFVPTDGLVAAACVNDHFDDWSEDGVHPNEALSALIGGFYADAFDKIFVGCRNK